MKILVIHNRYRHEGGEEQVVGQEARLLTEAGHNIEFLFFDNLAIRNWLDKLKLSLRIFYNPHSVALLKERISTFAPDIVHVHNFFPLASPSLFYVASRFHIPVVVTLHNFRLVCPSTVLFYKGKLYDRSIRSWFPVDAIIKGVYRNSRVQTAASALAFTAHNMMGTWRRKVDKFIVLTAFAETKFLESKLRIRRAQLVVKPNFVYDPDGAAGVREDSFLYVGRLSPEKGLSVVLGSAAAFGFKLVIVGDGPMAEEVRQYAAQCDNISWLGFRDRAAVIRVMQTCRALIIPSVCYEGFPLSALEAFSTGTPVIASRLGSLKDIVQDGYNGLHFSVGDKCDLFRAVSVLREDPDLFARLCLNARRTYLDHYTPAKNYEMLLSIYESVLRTPRLKTTGPVGQAA